MQHERERLLDVAWAPKCWPEIAGSPPQRLHGGLESRAWRVDTAAGVFVLKHAGEAEREQQAAEVRLLNRLHDAGLGRVPNVVRGPVTDVGGHGAWILLTWVPGELRPLSRSADAAKVGRLLRSVHDSLGSDVASLHPVRRYDSTHVGACRARLAEFVRIDDGKPALEEATMLAGETVDMLAEDSVTVLHADIHDGNVVWDDDRPGLIDFGRCGSGPPLLDVAMAQHYLDHLTARAVLRGYAEADDVNHLHLDRLPALRFAAALDNFATLAAVPDERAWVESELSWLLEQAQALLR